MKKLWWVVALGSSICVWACGDDSGDDGGSATGGSAGDASSGGGTATGGGSGIPPSVCEPSGQGGASGVCVNTTDCPFIDTDGESKPSQARDQAGDCFFQQCSQEADVEACVSECLVDELGMTAGCSDCYAGSVNCTVQNCLSKCIDPASAECISCQTDAGCIGAFYQCSGLPVPSP